MNGNVIIRSLKMIEVYMQGNRKEMDYDVKECENGWEMATFLQVGKREDLRDLNILSYSFIHFIM